MDMMFNSNLMELTAIINIIYVILKIVLVVLLINVIYKNKDDLILKKYFDKDKLIK